MKVEINYHVLPDPENIIGGVIGEKGGGVKSIEIDFYPNEKITKTKEFIAFGEALQSLINKQIELQSTLPLINLVPEN